MSDVKENTLTEHGEVTAFEAQHGRFARDPAAASAAGKVGGVKAGATRRRKAALREAARALLAMSPDHVPGAEDLAQVLAAAGITDATMADAVMLAQALKALRGDTEAARFVRDTSGERPADQVSITTGEVVDVDAVAEMTDAQLAELAAARSPEALPAAVDVAPGVAPAAEQAPQPVDNQ